MSEPRLKVKPRMEQSGASSGTSSDLAPLTALAAAEPTARLNCSDSGENAPATEDSGDPRGPHGSGPGETSPPTVSGINQRAARVETGHCDLHDTGCCAEGGVPGYRPWRRPNACGFPYSSGRD